MGGKVGLALLALIPRHSVHRGPAKCFGSGGVDWDLTEYDVVEYALDNDDLGLGVVVADGRVQPLCAWRDGGPEFVWDEDAPTVEASRVRRVIDAWPTSRQLDGGMGPANPHGDICEDVYIVEPADLSERTSIVVRTDREWW